MCGRVSAKINIIRYNTVEGLEWSRPSRALQERFQSILRKHGVVATLRREKGHDIAAACGQLRLQTKQAAFHNSYFFLDPFFRLLIGEVLGEIGPREHG